MMNKDFERFAISSGISSNMLNGYKKNYINPTIIEERQMNMQTWDVFSRLMAERIIYLGEGINSDVANIITAQLLYLDSVSNEDITIFVNTPGGSVYDGMAIVDTMNYINSEVGTTCVGLAASMGSVILSSGEKGKRLILPHSRVLIHQPLGGTSGAASDIMIAAEEIIKTKKRLNEILAFNTNQSVEKIAAGSFGDLQLVAKWENLKVYYAVNYELYTPRMNYDLKNS